MRGLFALSALLCGACDLCWQQVEAPCHEPFETTVVRIVDGDTLEIDPPITMDDGAEIDRVRLLCINTPETHGTPACYGEEAAAWMATRLEGVTVTLYFAEDCTDTYQRALAYVKEGPGLVNIELAELGYALPIDEWFADQPCCDEVVAAVDQARADGVGGWGACAGYPWTE
ncbi:MAG: thermonuclease family protein [Pseudomonadota bacterium]